MTQQLQPSQDSLDWVDPVAMELAHSANQFDFFQAIRRIESLSSHLPRVGHAAQAKQEGVRIGQTPALDFAPSTIDRMDPGHDGRIHLQQRFFGLLGPGGPLPLHMTERVRDQLRHEGDPTLESFLNLFHHRMATLFYRAWSSSRGAIQRDRPGEDRFASHVAALSGVMPVTRNNAATGRAEHDREPLQATCEDTRLYFTGRFGSAHRNGEGLEAIVSATVHAVVRVRTFVLRQLKLQTEDRTLLSAVPTPQGRGGCLGRSVVLGRSVPDRRSLIEIEIGPIAFTVFRRVLPGGDLHGSLRDLIRSYLDPGIDCRIRLVLDHQTVPRMSLGREGSLGRNAWLHSKPPQVDVADCQFQI